jgi:hypothetical protein
LSYVSSSDENIALGKEEVYCQNSKKLFVEVCYCQIGVFMFEELVELGEKGLSEDEVDARNFRAKLLGLMYEDLLCVWFSECGGYKVVGRDVRSGLYDGKRVAVDFILEKDGRLYVVEAKCWPAYDGGRFKKLTLKNINRVRREFKTHFLNEDFVSKYRFKGRGVDGKILVWWDVEESEAERIKDELKLDGLIPLKQVLNELKGNDKAESIIKKRKEWANQLFNALLK